MYCEKHRKEYRLICTDRRCSKPWMLCGSCTGHDHHKVQDMAEFARHLRNHVASSNSFQEAMRRQVLDLVAYEVEKICGVVRKLVEETLGETIRDQVHRQMYVKEPLIQLAVRQYEDSGLFKQKYRSLLLGVDTSPEYEKENQTFLREKQISKVQISFFELSTRIRHAIQTQRGHSQIGQNQDSRVSLVHKHRSYSTKSSQSSTSFNGQKRKKRLANHNIFNETTIKETKIKKTVKQNPQFVQQPSKSLNHGQDFLRLVQERVARKIEEDKKTRCQPPSILLTQTKNNLAKDPLRSPLKQKKPQNLRQSEPLEQKQLYCQQVQNPDSQIVTPTEQVSSLLTHTTTPQQSTPGSTSKLQQKSFSKASLKKESKIQKRVQIYRNIEENSVQQIVDLTEKKLTPKARQEIESRLKIVPEVSAFLKKNLPQMEDVWKSSDDACWSLYFQIKETVQSEDHRYADQKRRCKNIQSDKAVLVANLASNVQKIKITSISKPRNHLILQYLVKYSSQLVILLQGAHSKPNHFSAQAYLNTLSSLADGDVKGAYEYVHSNVEVLKRLV